MTEKPNEAFQIADLLMDSGLTGFALMKALRENFPHAKRDAVYQAIGIAWTYQQAGWMADACELDLLLKAKEPT